MDKSKIPVPKSQGAHNPEKTHISDQTAPCPKKPCPPKPTLPLYNKDPNIVFSASAPDVGVFKAVSHGKKNIASKKPSAPTRGVTNRYRMEAELRDRNQLLEAANVSLHANLTNTQDTIKVMTERQAELENELKELNRRLEKNMIILENRNIDPVSGEEILASVEETSKLRSETKTVMSKWKEADKGRNQFVEEQQAFERELEQFRECLLQAEKQLDE
ncbi:small kinetochore-associated protein isoform X2 [Xenopus laevis]|uniref:Small kinetochore-associated protein isoform X2 n=1 Tax=Xenopus laevis TaxID=8355 RepID=A0A8J0TL63_XENLA|nr:small kinetochore-associated protein isoform X2 [Xenopus laevis]